MTLLVAPERMREVAPHRMALRVCAHCSQPRASRICDWRGAGGGTPCDKFLCDECAAQPTPGKDLCRQHAERWSRQQALRQGASA